jgi:hypothetical protein
MVTFYCFCWALFKANFPIFIHAALIGFLFLNPSKILMGLHKKKSPERDLGRTRCRRRRVKIDALNKVNKHTVTNVVFFSYFLF